jgi:AcrR family transcriptional regulator
MVPSGDTRGEKTRERLVEAAVALFSEKGYAATGTRAIAARARCNVALISHYFGSKEGLLRETITRALTVVSHELRALRAEPGRPEARLRRFIEFMVDHFDRNCQGMQIVHRDLIQAESALRAVVAPIVAANLEMLTAILEEARAEGRLADVEPKTASLLLMGMLQHYFINYPIACGLIGERSPETMASLKRHVTQIFLGGILKGAEKSP